MSEIVYWEIPTTDVEKTSAFYAALFGWKTTPSSDRYVMVETPGGGLGGIEQVDPPPGHGVAIYVGVDDIPATLARVEALGGTVVKGKTKIGKDYGYWASFRDPGGCRSVMIWSKT